MKWSPQQDKALLDFKRWYADRSEEEQVFTLYGYAGTGKTTLAMELVQAIEGDVLFAAFTGKAASVLRKRGCDGAMTLHSLLYNSKQASKKRLLELEDEKADLLREIADEGMSTAHAKQLRELDQGIIDAKKNASKPSWELNPYSPLAKAALLVVDEVSMVDGRLGADILSFGKPVLVMGDPAQLPPVSGTGFFNTSKPNVMLTEVHRHALDNPILALATQIRRGEVPDHGTYGESRIVHKRDVQHGEALDYDQVLVGKNATRQRANRTMRDRLGYSGTYPLPGEKVICLRNDREQGFLNGTLWTVKECHGDDDSLELTVISDEGVESKPCLAYPEPFRYEDVPQWGGNMAAFTYGYAVTTHKAQGSEWDKVYIVDESAVFKKDAGRWLYTAVTRASKQVLLIRD